MNKCMLIVLSVNGTALVVLFNAVVVVFVIIIILFFFLKMYIEHHSRRILIDKMIKWHLKDVI